MERGLFVKELFWTILGKCNYLFLSIEALISQLRAYIAYLVIDNGQNYILNIIEKIEHIQYHLLRFFFKCNFIRLHKQSVVRKTSQQFNRYN